MGITRSNSHGLTGTPEWNSWYNIVLRCHYKTSTIWKYYGGRGITMDLRWLGPDGFATFLEDMGEMPNDNMEVERKNNDGNYNPGNCSWATRTRQMRNTSKTMRDANGIAVIDLAEAAGIPMSTVSQRVRKLGWTLEKALSTPKVHNGVIPMPERPTSRRRQR